MGRRRAGAAVAASAVAILAVPALSGCTSASSTLSRDPGRPVDQVAATGTPAGSVPAAQARALSTALSSAFSSAATRAASVAATAARSAARTSTHAAPPPPTRPATRAAALPTGRASVHSAPVVTGDSSIESEIFSMINQERASNGLPALQLSGALTASARRHSIAMAADQELSHQLPGEGDLTQREAAAGFHGSAWAENVGMTPQGASGAAGLQNLLYSDPPHRANILSKSMHAVGVGVVIDSRGQLWLTEDFGG